MPPQPTLPRSWPANVKYLHKPEISKTIDKQTLIKLHTKPASPCTIITEKAGPCTLVRITPITSPTHPANGQYGLFSTQSIPPDTFILFYLGFMHSRDDADTESDYDLSLDRELGIGVDATRMGNEARFTNDYRGVADAPNAEFREVWVQTGKGMVEKRMAIYVLSAGKSGKRAKGIAKGSEILVSYGKGFWQERKADEASEAIV